MEEIKQEIQQNSENTGKKDTRWKPGQSGNPAGRPKGSKNFSTLFKKAIKDVAQKLELGEDPDAVEIEIIKKGIKEALSGKYPFYKDIFDRLYGQPTKSIDITTGGEQLHFSEERIKEIAKLVLEKEKNGE